MNEEPEKKCIRAFRWIVFFHLTVAPQLIGAQSVLPEEVEAHGLEIRASEEGDSIVVQNDERQKAKAKKTKTTTEFSPNPKTAWKVAMFFPGLGQYYNRQYWKLPIVYGGLMGCTYAITWNNKTYQDYKDAYFRIMADAKADPNAEHPETWSDRWQIFLSSSTDPATRLHNTSFHNTLKRNKDYFRRYRDLSIIITIAVYMISVADAYVDAQMFNFDVSPDLSFNFAPAFMPQTYYHSHCYGFKINLTF